jgi:hypothetical protein
MASDKPEQPPSQTKQPTAAQEQRRARLAAELRANLKKRKALAKEKAEGDAG